MRPKLVLFAILVVVGLLGVALVCGYFMPGQWRSKAETTIQAPAENVHAWVSDLERWPQWFPWTTAKDPEIRYTFRAPKSGVGAVLEWSSAKVGNATLTLTKCDPLTGVAYDLSFAGSRQPSHGEILYAPTGGITTVTWTDGGDLGSNPIARLFRAPIERMLSEEFEHALARLRALAEAPQVPAQVAPKDAPPAAPQPAPDAARENG